MPTPRLLLSIAVAAALAATLAPVVASSAAPPAPAVATAQEQSAFVAAANEYGVPASVLLALSYAQTRWEAHAGAPSASGGYGPMHLLDPTGADSRGDSARPASTRDGALQRAAALVDQSPAAVRADVRQNIRAGAALLASYARSLNAGSLPRSTSGWYAAVAKYSGATGTIAASEFADDVYATLASGAAATTRNGQSLRLTAQPTARPDRSKLAALHLQSTKAVDAAECPSGLDCRFIPAAYQLNSADVGDYGNYDTANRPNDVKIQYIVIHDTEGSYDGTVAEFQNPRAYVTAHYVIRSSDGQITQMVHNKDVAWHAGNWNMNMHSIGIEHEGVAIEGASWYTEALYRSSARLVRYLAARYGIPLDRAHIIGHDNVQGTVPANVAGMHWDPGPYWDWAHYLDLLGARIHSVGGPVSDIVTVNPRFATNQPVVTGCGAPPTAVCPAQGTSFVYLHTAPSDSAPLLADPAIHADGTPGSTQANDVGDKAVAGQRFAVADRAAGWVAIWYAGQKGWLRNNPKATSVLPVRGHTLTGLPGVTATPVYGRAYPEAAAYPAGVPPQSVTPLQYTIGAGQRYVLADRNPVRGDYYYAKTIDLSLPHDHTDIVGNDLYYLIYFGHRTAYVRAVDVKVG